MEFWLECLLQINEDGLDETEEATLARQQHAVMADEAIRCWCEATPFASSTAQRLDYLLCLAHARIVIYWRRRRLGWRSAGFPCLSLAGR